MGAEVRKRGHLGVTHDPAEMRPRRERQPAEVAAPLAAGGLAAAVSMASLSPTGVERDLRIFFLHAARRLQRASRGPRGARAPPWRAAAPAAVGRLPINRRLPSLGHCSTKTKRYAESKVPAQKAPPNLARSTRNGKICTTVLIGSNISYCTTSSTPLMYTISERICFGCAGAAVR